MNGTEMMGFAVAFYVGAALMKFFDAVTRDLVTPILAGIFPGVQQTVDKLVIQVGSVKISIGDAIGATFNLLIAFLVVSWTLPLIKTYAPIGGRR
jgi:large-conductance mechanosensitive channel